ncbi:MAG: TolC family protein [Candidatus Latescibacteria bacterium]|jgi:outer membrane protein TolC|nr:TolC family protein [Candidatus Latescibacterota bacterium]
MTYFYAFGRGLCFLLCLGSILDAAEPVSPDSALAVSLMAIHGEPLKLQGAKEAALARSSSVKIAQNQVYAAAGVVQRERGTFDPEVFAELTRSGNDQAASSPFSGASVLEQNQTSAQAGVQMVLPIGTELEASVVTTRLESNSNFSSLNPQYSTTGSLRFRQPILDGFFNRKDLTSAERLLDAAKARYDDAVLRTEAEVEGLYWNLYAAERDLAVQMLVSDQAQVLLREAQLRAKAGLVGPNQVANAQVFLASQQLALLDREETLDRISDDLAALIGMRPERLVRFWPVDTPQNTFELASVDQVMADVLVKNKSLLAIRADAEALRALAQGADRDRLPTVDLVGALGGNGLSGTGQDVVFGADTLRATASGGYGDALSQVLKRDFPTWEVGISVRIPIGNRTDKGESERLRAEVGRTDQVYAGAARELDSQVRAEYRALKNGKQRLDVAGMGVEAAAEQVRIGLLEYRNGRTTAFELARLSADFATAQQQYSQALVRTARAAAALRYLTAGQYP